MDASGDYSKMAIEIGLNLRRRYNCDGPDVAIADKLKSYDFHTRAFMIINEYRYFLSLSLPTPVANESRQILLLFGPPSHRPVRF